MGRPAARRSGRLSDAHGLSRPADGRGMAGGRGHGRAPLALRLHVPRALRAARAQARRHRAICASPRRPRPRTAADGRANGGAPGAPHAGSDRMAHRPRDPFPGHAPGRRHHRGTGPRRRGPHRTRHPPLLFGAAIRGAHRRRDAGRAGRSRGLGAGRILPRVRERRPGAAHGQREHRPASSSRTWG